MRLEDIQVGGTYLLKWGRYPVRQVRVTRKSAKSVWCEAPNGQMVGRYWPPIAFEPVPPPEPEPLKPSPLWQCILEGVCGVMIVIGWIAFWAWASQHIDRNMSVLGALSPLLIFGGFQSRKTWGGRSMRPPLQGLCSGDTISKIMLGLAITMTTLGIAGWIVICLWIF